MEQFLTIENLKSFLQNTGNKDAEYIVCIKEKVKALAEMLLPPELSKRYITMQELVLRKKQAVKKAYNHINTRQPCNIIFVGESTLDGRDIAESVYCFIAEFCKEKENSSDELRRVLLATTRVSIYCADDRGLLLLPELADITEIAVEANTSDWFAFTMQTAAMMRDFRPPAPISLNNRVIRFYYRRGAKYVLNSIKMRWNTSEARRRYRLPYTQTTQYGSQFCCLEGYHRTSHTMFPLTEDETKEKTVAANVLEHLESGFFVEPVGDVLRPDEAAFLLQFKIKGLSAFHLALSEIERYSEESGDDFPALALKFGWYLNSSNSKDVPRTEKLRADMTETATMFSKFGIRVSDCCIEGMLSDSEKTRGAVLLDKANDFLRKNI